LLLSLYNTGARVSEIISLQRSHFSFGVKSFVQFKGKGRKERSVPLWHSTAKALQAWFRELGGSSSAIAFPNARGSSLTRDGVNYILQQAVERAAVSSPSLKNKRVFPHIFRHYLPFLTMSSTGTPGSYFRANARSGSDIVLTPPSNPVQGERSPREVVIYTSENGHCRKRT
jgi:integrase